MACTEEPCFIMGVTVESLACTAGHCSLGVNCSREDALCNTPEPDCGSGRVASVIERCWGPCIDASDCAAVDSCRDCDPARHVCVLLEAQLLTTVCVEVPEECSEKRDCDCLAPSVCVEPFDTCVVSEDNQLTCS
jgi:hypothetical protein